MINRIREKLLAGGIGFILCFAISPLSAMLLDALTSTTKEVVETNTDTIDLIANAAQKLHDNSDLLMRSNHYLNNHTTTQLLCPVCGELESTKKLAPEMEPIVDPPVNLPATVNQLLRDAKEIRQSVFHLGLSLRIQGETLTQLLSKLEVEAQEPSQQENQ